VFGAARWLIKLPESITFVGEAFPYASPPHAETLNRNRRLYQAFQSREISIGAVEFDSFVRAPLQQPLRSLVPKAAIESHEEDIRKLDRQVMADAVQISKAAMEQCNALMARHRVTMRRLVDEEHRSTVVLNSLKENASEQIRAALLGPGRGLHAPPLAQLPPDLEVVTYEIFQDYFSRAWQKGAEPRVYQKLHVRLAVPHPVDAEAVMSAPERRMIVNNLASTLGMGPSQVELCVEAMTPRSLATQPEGEPNAAMYVDLNSPAVAKAPSTSNLAQQLATLKSSPLQLASAALSPPKKKFPPMPHLAPPSWSPAQSQSSNISVSLTMSGDAWAFSAVQPRRPAQERFLVALGAAIQVPRASLKVTDYTVHDAQSIGAELKVSTASVHQTRCALKRLEGQEVGGFRCATISTDVKTHSQPSLPAKVVFASNPVPAVDPLPRRALYTEEWEAKSSAEFIENFQEWLQFEGIPTQADKAPSVQQPQMTFPEATPVKPLSRVELSLTLEGDSEEFNGTEWASTLASCLGKEPRDVRVMSIHAEHKSFVDVTLVVDTSDSLWLERMLNRMQGQHIRGYKLARLCGYSTI